MCRSFNISINNYFPECKFNAHRLCQGVPINDLKWVNDEGLDLRKFPNSFNSVDRSIRREFKLFVDYSQVHTINSFAFLSLFNT